MKKELSMAQKIKYLKTKGAILTFKTPQKWKDQEYKQIIVTGIRKENKRYTILSYCFDSPSRNTIEELTELIDWVDYQERLEFCKEMRS
jgi:hypothetical protein